MAHQQEGMQETTAQDQEKRPMFFINDHIGILIEVLKRLDGPSLGVPACVCRLWCTLARNDDSLGISLLPPRVQSSATLGTTRCFGSRRIQAALYGLRSAGAESTGDSERVGKRVWTWNELQLSLSLFCIDSYERLGRSGRLGGGASASSLMFLCNSVNV